jgi:hypothetical protein
MGKKDNKNQDSPEQPAALKRDSKSTSEGSEKLKRKEYERELSRLQHQSKWNLADVYTLPIAYTPRRPCHSHPVWST